jgi:predicted small lipoprotein YifL
VGEAAGKTAKLRLIARISLQFLGTLALAMFRQSLYGAARIGDIVVKLNFRQASGWAVVLLSVVALSFAGCGRKGGLDLPPSANGGPTTLSAAPDSETEAANKPSVFNPTYGADAAPQASRGSKKSFILDPLLDERR